MTDSTIDSATGHSDESPSGKLALGLESGYRYRCEGCGNVTRFDVVAVARTRRFHHFDLGGQGRVAEEEVLDATLESVTCRWCGRGDTVHVERAPTAEHP